MILRLNNYTHHSRTRGWRSATGSRLFDLHRAYVAQEVLPVGGLQGRERRLVALNGVDQLLRRRQQAQVLVVYYAVVVRRRGVGGGGEIAAQHNLAQRDRRARGGLALRPLRPLLLGTPQERRRRRSLRPLHPPCSRACEGGAAREHAVGVDGLEVAQAHLQVWQRAGGRGP